MKTKFKLFVGAFALGLIAPSWAAPQGNLENFSALLQIPAGGASPALGFVVSAATPFLIRAVGPSLASFGTPSPAALPLVHFFDGTGKEIFFVHSAIALNWPAIFASVGAFPLTGSGDAYEVDSFTAGAYSVQVTDNSGKGGAVLLELYQAPAVIPAGGSVAAGGEDANP